MRKFTNIRKEHFRHLVLNCIIHYPEIDYRSEIGADHFNHVRAELKQDVKKNLTCLQWKLMEDNPDKPILQKSCLSELHQSTITL
jgi:hypothetical protein